MLKPDKYNEKKCSRKKLKPQVAKTMNLAYQEAPLIFILFLSLKQFQMHFFQSKLSMLTIKNTSDFKDKIT